MRLIDRFTAIAYILVAVCIGADANTLQNAIDSAPPGSILKLSAGIYKGNVIIDKPLEILGREDAVIIEGLGEGSVITVNSSQVKLKNITITQSGNRHDALDAAVFVGNAENITVENCIIERTLFGIFLDNVNHSAIINNIISSNGEDVGLRGDSVRLWFSHGNLIQGNTFIESRDLVLMHSNANTVADNTMQACRYGVFAQHTKQTLIRNNRIKESAVGVLLEGSMDINVTDNTIVGHHGAQTSLGILLKGGSYIHVRNNRIGQCNQALYLDNSPKMRDATNWIRDNTIMYSTIGLDFRNHSVSNVVTGNELFGNMDSIMSDSYSGKTSRNAIEGNYWDDYEGFDANGDNVGDSPYRKYLYLDQIFETDPDLRFFFGSPVVSMINFMLKIAPFMEPVFLAEDKKPVFTRSE